MSYLKTTAPRHAANRRPARRRGWLRRIAVAGFRVRETALGLSSDAVGRTTAVTGTVVIPGSRVASAAIRVDLAAITGAGKRQPQVATSPAYQGTGRIRLPRRASRSRCRRVPADPAPAVTANGPKVLFAQA